MDLGFCPDERRGGFVVVGDEGVDVHSGTLLKDCPSSDFMAWIENQISIWLSQEACVGV